MSKFWAGCGLAALMLWPSPVIAGAAYKIVSNDGPADAVRVTVRLEARQSEADLRAIADDVRARLPAAKIVRSVAFYLPAMPLAGNAWAEVRQQPSQSVTVSGLRLEEEIAYRSEAAADTRKRIGVWLTSPPALPGRLTIYRAGPSKIFAEWQLRNGQTTTDALIESRGTRGRRYDIAGGDGGYYQLGANGTLELGNRSTVIAVAEPLKVTAPAAPVAAVAAPSVQKAIGHPPSAAALTPGKPTAEATAIAPEGALTQKPLIQAPVARRTATAKSRNPNAATRRAEAGVGDTITRALSR